MRKKQPVLPGSWLNKARSRLAGPARFSYDSSKIYNELIIEPRSRQTETARFCRADFSHMNTLLESRFFYGHPVHR